MAEISDGKFAAVELFASSLSSRQTKIAAIKARFAQLIGARLTRCETAQMLVVGNGWEDWPNLPVRIFTDSEFVVSISWSKFDDLWIVNDAVSLPFSHAGIRVRWRENAVPAIRPAIGQAIRAVMLGRGEMSVEGNDLEIWTRLLIRLDQGWLEVFNDLDENGYDYHEEQPQGHFIPCM